jgi:drug/metabolite transporter (DMT)-like permease
MDAAAGTGANLLWMLLGARVGAFATLSGVALWVRPPLELPPRSGIVLMGIGLIDLSANGAFLLASSRGLLSLVSVLGSLYSVVTIALALRFLREHVSPAQIAGIVLALGGVAMIAAA